MFIWNKITINNGHFLYIWTYETMCYMRNELKASKLSQSSMLCILFDAFEADFFLADVFVDFCGIFELLCKGVFGTWVFFFFFEFNPQELHLVKWKLLMRFSRQLIRFFEYFDVFLEFLIALSLFFRYNDESSVELSEQLLQVLEFVLLLKGKVFKCAMNNLKIILTIKKKLLNLGRIMSW